MEGGGRGYSDKGTAKEMTSVPRSFGATGARGLSGETSSGGQGPRRREHERGRGRRGREGGSRTYTPGVRLLRRAASFVASSSGLRSEAETAGSWEGEMPGLPQHRRLRTGPGSPHFPAPSLLQIPVLLPLTHPCRWAAPTS